MTKPSICVFCGSRSGARPTYAEAARATGRIIARNGWRLVYGAGDVGIMGEVSQAAHEAGASSLGVIPAHLCYRERAGQDLANVIVTETMHERKKIMFTNSDAVVVLPGGAGSLDEFFEVLTWAQIGLHRKPIFLLDVEGYWTPLNALIQHIVREGFAHTTILDLFTSVPDAEAVETALQRFFAAV